MSWWSDLSALCVLFSDPSEGQQTMAARQQGHKHGRRVLRPPRKLQDWTDAEGARGDMGAERASRGVLAQTMAIGRPQQLCANLRNSISLFGVASGGSWPQLRRKSDETIENCCHWEVSTLGLFVQMQCFCFQANLTNIEDPAGVAISSTSEPLHFKNFQFRRPQGSKL